MTYVFVYVACSFQSVRHFHEGCVNAYVLKLKEKRLSVITNQER